MNSSQSPPLSPAPGAAAQAHRHRVQGVFDAAAPGYDRMNDLMTLGAHRLLKRLALDLAVLRPHHRVLDLATGTGDLALLAHALVGQEGLVVGLDANPRMLELGRDRLLDKGIGDLPMLCGRAEQLPFADASFDRVLIGFGLRNFSDRDAALAETARCLRPGGRLVVLELAQPGSRRLARLYDAVSIRLLPALGARVTGSPAPYRYLHDSIRRQPPPAEVRRQILDAGFAHCDCHRLFGGIFCLYLAEKD